MEYKVVTHIETQLQKREGYETLSLDVTLREI